MTSRLFSMLLESLYGTFVLTFYYLIWITFFNLNPFYIGYHPPTDFQPLVPVVLFMLMSTIFLKSIALVYRECTKVPASQRFPHYPPDQRH